MQRILTNSPRTAFQHLRHTVFRALRNVIVFGLLGLVLGAAATEVAGTILTGALPSAPTHVAAGAIGVLLGYALAITVVFRALLTGVVESMEWVVGEVERLVGGVVHEAESVLHLPEEIAHSAEVPARVGGPSGPAGGMIRGIQDEP